SPWTKIRKATEFSPCCPQSTTGLDYNVTHTSEDCLYLNLWTPARSPSDRLPVMVWIHGGSYINGAGSLPMFDGADLAKKDVVLVTINYRLGPFGFFTHRLLSAESPRGVSGNYGLLDQIAALQWVQKNISSFGGDPLRVTVFGESAGASSISRLVVSPLAKGHFQRAIIQSGGPFDNVFLLPNASTPMKQAERAGRQLVKALGYDKAPDVLAAMRTISSEKIMAAAKPAPCPHAPGMHFGPVVDGWVLPDNPWALFAEGKYHDVPIIIGCNADEGSQFIATMPFNKPAFYKQIVQGLFGVKYAKDMLVLFPASQSSEVKPALNKLVTAMGFASPARFTAKAMDRNRAKAYLYHFTHLPQTKKAKRLGVYHGLEIPYVFGKLNASEGYNDKDFALSGIMMDYWVSFAATGDPNSPDRPHWPSYDGRTDQYLELSDPITVQSGLYKQACDLIEKIHSDRKRKVPVRKRGR
ncbi:MAG: carboxylesterase family protein, partial [Deltaproteobacteria bacterium]|nr:carboxylesterase family protein [Deltaproteobacteria bacterium]